MSDNAVSDNTSKCELSSNILCMTATAMGLTRASVYDCDRNVTDTCVCVCNVISLANEEHVR